MNKKKYLRSRFSKRIIIKYIITLIIYTAVIITGLIFCKAVLHTRYWYRYDIKWEILHWLDTYRYPVAVIVISVGWTLISFCYIKKLLNYLDAIISESGKLASPEGSQIELQPALNDVQNELNLLRERAKNSAAAAKEAEQRKNDLIVYLAHDLKTPLTSIIGYLSLLYDEPEIPLELRLKYTGISLEKAKRLEELINEFFDITRFNLTNISLETSCINFSRMVEQTAFEFNPIISEKGLTWQLDIEDNIMLSCDADKMERVLDNLIKNAVYYSYPDTPVKINLTKDNENIIFSIENKGKTISKEKLNRIFEQFFRLDSSRGTETGGAGLGLAIAKEIIELHNGKIYADSQNEHIIFTVKLPL